MFTHERALPPLRQLCPAFWDTSPPSWHLSISLSGFVRRPAKATKGRAARALARLGLALDALFQANYWEGGREGVDSLVLPARSYRGTLRPWGLWTSAASLIGTLAAAIAWDRIYGLQGQKGTRHASGSAVAGS